MTLTITNGIDEVDWVYPVSVPVLSTGSVHIWRINTITSSETLGKYCLILNQEEQNKAKRFFKPDDRQRFISSHAALRTLLSAYLNQPAASIEFTTDQNKKPRLVSQSGLCFNLSHSGNYSLISIANCETGVDIEQVNTTFAYEDVLRGFFSTTEAKYVNASASPVRTFYNLWTRKESFGKALSRGFIDDMTAIPCLTGIHNLQSELTKFNWLTRSFVVYPQHIGSITIAGTLNSKLHYFDFEKILVR